MSLSKFRPVRYSRKSTRRQLIYLTSNDSSLEYDLIFVVAPLWFPFFS